MIYHKDGRLQVRQQNQNKQSEDGQFWNTFMQLREHPAVLELKKYPSHKISNLYDHSSRVALCSYHLAKRMHLKFNEKSLAKGAMLHDFYLYQARGNKEIGPMKHWFRHPMTALHNAEETFHLTKKEKNIITSHMWPVVFLPFPKSREAILVGLADKICAFGELILKRNHVRITGRPVRKTKSRQTLTAGSN